MKSCKNCHYHPNQRAFFNDDIHFCQKKETNPQEIVCWAYTDFSASEDTAEENLLDNQTQRYIY